MEASWFQSFLEQLSQFLHSPLVMALAFAYLVKNFISFMNPLPKEPENSRVIHIDSEASWNQAVKAAKEANALVMVDFFATWCGPCKTAAPAFSALSAQYTNVHFLKVDVDKAYNVSKSMGVVAMPTFILCDRDGRVIEKIQGFNRDTPSRIMALIEKHSPKNSNKTDSNAPAATKPTASQKKDD